MNASANNPCRLKMLWTEAEIGRLIDLHKQGLISTEIARIMGTTKGSVLGKLKRLRDKETKGTAPLTIK